VSYGLPLLPNSVAQQILGNADRGVFAGRVAASQLAIYVSAYQVANIVNIMLSEVNRSRQHRYVLRSDAGHAIVERAERKLLLRIVAVTALPTAGASAVVSGLGFAESFGVALGICLSFTAIAFYLPVANLLSLSIGRTSALAKASIAGAVANVAINFALVYELGIWSGVIANLIGYFVMYWMLTRQRTAS
jgi:O-antigen/teichoic acid export membrane protein